MKSHSSRYWLVQLDTGNEDGSYSLLMHFNHPHTMSFAIVYFDSYVKANNLIFKSNQISSLGQWEFEQLNGSIKTIKIQNIS